MSFCYDVGRNSQDIHLRRLFQLAFSCPCKLADITGIGDILEYCGTKTRLKSFDFASSSEHE
ncbi:unnamed protein product [Brugia timori]|nr:unnamed protein product [Brugia timori]